jgi:hypothetical protein
MRRLAVSLAALVIFGWAIQARAQFSSADLDRLLQPVALYPDPLIAEMLPAATMPSEIVLADRYISQGGDPSQIEQQPWDQSVQAVAHYPNVLKWMDDNLPWTTQVGQAFLSQQQDVMAAVQRLRAQAQALGNLQTTSQESVVDDDGMIEIDPTDPNEIYVPDYQPDLIYTQPGIFCTFGIGFPIGFWFNHDWDWHHHSIIVWGHDNPRPGNWWRRSPAQRREPIGHGVGVWRPGTRSAVVANHADRGFEAPEAHHVYPTERASREPVRSFAPAPAPARESIREPSGGAFNSSQGSRETRESSARGQESRGSMSEPARSAPSFGGGRSEGSSGGGRKR